MCGGGIVCVYVFPGKHTAFDELAVQVCEAGAVVGKLHLLPGKRVFVKKSDSIAIDRIQKFAYIDIKDATWRNS